MLKEIVNLLQKYFQGINEYENKIEHNYSPTFFFIYHFFYAKPYTVKDIEESCYYRHYDAHEDRIDILEH